MDDAQTFPFIFWENIIFFYNMTISFRTSSGACCTLHHHQKMNKKKHIYLCPAIFREESRKKYGFPEKKLYWK